MKKYKRIVVVGIRDADSLTIRHLEDELRTYGDKDTKFIVINTDVSHTEIIDVNLVSGE